MENYKSHNIWEKIVYEQYMYMSEFVKVEKEMEINEVTLQVSMA